MSQLNPISPNEDADDDLAWVPLEDVEDQQNSTTGFAYFDFSSDGKEEVLLSVYLEEEAGEQDWSEIFVDDSESYVVQEDEEELDGEDDLNDDGSDENDEFDDNLLPNDLEADEIDFYGNLDYAGFAPEEAVVDILVVDDNVWHQPTFDPTEADFDYIAGEPDTDMEHWHLQAHDDTCAVVAQEFILNELTGQTFSEEELRQEAIENGWYHPGGGTTLSHIGNLLEAHGIEVERGNEFTLEDLSLELEQGHKIVVGVDAHKIWPPASEEELLCNILGIPEKPEGHAVEVIGVDETNPENPWVILNDPGHPEGRGMMIPADQFMDAWGFSNGYMVHTTD